MSKKQNNEIKNEGKWIIEESSYGQCCQFSVDKPYSIDKNGNLQIKLDATNSLDFMAVYGQGYLFGSDKGYTIENDGRSITLRPSWLDNDRAWYIDENGNVQIRKDVK